MRQALSKGMLTAAAATSILSLPGGQALAADADAAAVGSPGVVSGNTVSAPITVPVNVSGNSVNGASLLNPTFGNGAANTTGHGSVADAPHPAAVDYPVGSPYDPYAHGGPGGAAAAPQHRPARAPGEPTSRSAPAPESAPARSAGSGKSGQSAKHAAPKRTAPKHAASAKHAAPGKGAPGRTGSAKGTPAKATSAKATPAKAAKPAKSGKHAKTAKHAANAPADRLRSVPPVTRAGGSSAEGAAVGSPGVLAGNLGQLPVSVPVNLCGNTVNVIALLNPVFGTVCANTAGATHNPPPRVTVPPQRPTGPSVSVDPPREAPHVQTPGSPWTPGHPGAPGWPGSPESTSPPRIAPAHEHRATPGAPALADTGAGAATLGIAAASAALLVGGGVLYRRAARAARR
ncbi:chaplin family protein [Streptomyces sp. NPDC059578]|uniref:chaplin family protein n=1 Tax=unclassified Streptomyces TaxID=2593676 RepID=UPI0036604689